MSLIPHALKLQKEEMGFLAPIFLREEEMAIYKDKLKTCKWCYKIYLEIHNSQHEDCNKKRRIYFRNLQTKDKQNKFKERRTL